MLEILVADPIAKSAVAGLATLATKVTYMPEVNSEQLPGAVVDAGILIVRSTRVDERTLEAAGQLMLIVRAGASVNNIDVNTATRKGIFVANCPGKNAAAVAELVIGLLIALDRNIVAATHDLRNGQWNKRAYPYGMGLAGNTLGVLGFGPTGKAVAAAARGLNMGVLAWSRSLTPKEASMHDVSFCATPKDLARRADVVSIHLAANSATYHLVDRHFLQELRDGAYLINTSRGEIVDTNALKAAVQRKGLRVALDVFEKEPKSDGTHFEDAELAEMIVATPHIGASTRQSLEATSREAVRVVGVFLSSGLPPNAVNAPAAKNETPIENDYVYANSKIGLPR